jgi:hypothetical protein
LRYVCVRRSNVSDAPRLSFGWGKMKDHRELEPFEFIILRLGKLNNKIEVVRQLHLDILLLRGYSRRSQ